MLFILAYLPSIMLLFLKYMGDVAFVTTRVFRLWPLAFEGSGRLAS
jgi:hypothetical protein